MTSKLNPETEAPPYRRLCTDCGLSRTSKPKLCGSACQFVKPNYADFERELHGRTRATEHGDEHFFGVYQAMYRAKMARPQPGAQWTGITTALAAASLRNGMLDAVLTLRPDPNDRWRGIPTLVTDPDSLANCRGMRMGFAPLLSLLEEARDRNLKRLGVIGIPCQIYALRASAKQWDLDDLVVIGTPCSDNTTTENFHEFLGLLDEQPERITYLEFMPDYHVELRFDDGRRRRIPYLQLPISKLPSDFFPLTCQTCVDYTNSLADITVGYMGGDGEQWVLVRNDRGARLLDALHDQVILTAPTSRGQRKQSVRGFLANTERAAGGLPLRRMPNWLRPIMGWLMPRIGPRGLEFARARIEMKAIETVLHLRRRMPNRLKSMVPDHVWRIVEPYDLKPESTKIAGSTND